MIHSDPEPVSSPGRSSASGGRAREASNGAANSGRSDRARFHEYARTRNPELRNQLVLENERLVHYLASKFRPVSSISTEDLVQVGYLGLIAAVERYEPESGINFITFAAPTIVGMIKHCLRDQSWGVKVPRRVRELATRMRRLRDAVEQRLGRPPTPAEIAEAAGVGEEEILEAMGADAAYFSYSLDAHYASGPDEVGEAFQEMLGIEEPAYALLANQDAVRSVLEQLEPRQQAIIHGRFFRELSQMQVASELGISQMHVSRLERQALGRLKELLANQTELQ